MSNKKIELGILIAILMISTSCTKEVEEVNSAQDLTPTPITTTADQSNIPIVVAMDRYVWNNIHGNEVNLSSGLPTTMYFSFIDLVEEAESEIGLNNLPHNEVIEIIPEQLEGADIEAQVNDYLDISNYDQRRPKIVLTNGLTLNSDQLQVDINQEIAFCHSVMGMPCWELLLGTVRTNIVGEYVCLDLICFRILDVVQKTEKETASIDNQDMEDFGSIQETYIERYFEHKVPIPTLTFIFCGLEDKQLKGVTYVRTILDPNVTPELIESNKPPNG